jgi:transcriptional regulator with XRE-family HTH domain
MILLRRLLGDVLRHQRQRQGRTLREVSSSARVSLGYLSEVERGQKEASSELLAAICEALGVRMSEVLHDVSIELAASELREPALAGISAADGTPVPAEPSGAELDAAGAERPALTGPERAVPERDRPVLEPVVTSAVSATERAAGDRLARVRDVVAA